MFELFQMTHSALAVLIVYALWRHLSIRQTSTRLYMVIAGGIFVATSIIRSSRLIIRNMKWKQPYATAQVVPMKDIVRVHVRIPRPWKVQAGEYIYVWMPGVSFWSFLQSHPFMISWWDNDVDGKSPHVYLLVKPAAGFTQKLTQHDGGCVFRTWVDGPYGQIWKLGDYGNVLMFASGVGIAAQVPYIKELVRGYREHKVRTRGILLAWQLDKESESIC